MRLDGPHAGEVHHARLHLAALGREEQRRAIGVAGDELVVEPDGVAQNDGHVVRGRAFGRAAHHQRRAAGLARVLDGLDRPVGARNQDVGVIGEARRRSEPRKLVRVEARVRVVAEHREQRHVAREMRDHGAVLGRQIVEVVDGAKAARARHVLHDRSWIARDETDDVARHQPRIDVEAPASAVADDHRKLFALVEVRDAVGCGGGDPRGGCDRRDKSQPALAAGSVHCDLPLSCFVSVRARQRVRNPIMVLQDRMTTSSSAPSIR